VTTGGGTLSRGGADVTHVANLLPSGPAALDAGGIGSHARSRFPTGVHGMTLRLPALPRFTFALLIGLLLIGGSFVTALHAHPDGLTHTHCAACVSGQTAVDLARPQPAIAPLALDHGPVTLAARTAPCAPAASTPRTRAPPRG
jgi:hypothetical protein